MFNRERQVPLVINTKSPESQIKGIIVKARSNDEATAIVERFLQRVDGAKNIRPL